MVFSKGKQDGNIILTIDGSAIERVVEFRFLGVIMDENLSWKSQIKYVKTKISKNIFVMNKVKHILDYRTMQMLYCSLILSYFSYCVEVWGNTYTTNIKPLVILQKRAIRVIHKVEAREHTNGLFIKSRLMTCIDIVELQTLLVMFKAKSRTLPENIQDFFVFTAGNYEHRRKYDFKHPYARTTMKQMCISVCSVTLWNSLNHDLKACANIHQFKKMYKEKKSDNMKLLDKGSVIV